jgi:hypothetical protein
MAMERTPTTTGPCPARAIRFPNRSFIRNTNSSWVLRVARPLDAVGQASAGAFLHAWELIYKRPIRDFTRGTRHQLHPVLVPALASRFLIAEASHPEYSHDKDTEVAGSLACKMLL